MQMPQDFTERMKTLLKGEYADFLASYDRPRNFGLRVNTLKISPREFERLAPFHLTKVPWVDNAYFYEEQDMPARHPFYYAGLYYLQEPSAMTPASVLPVRPGDRVLDLCAAPGGKATELGAKLQGKGLLVANDISASRAKALLKNIEVFGISNAFVTNEVPAKLAKQFPEFFDRILVDAPCSGEGMFRKDPAAAKAWDAEKPLVCAKQQREIIRRAADMLVPGGQMLYSTCTFSVEENERIIAGLLAERPDLELLDIPWYEGFSHGYEGLEKCVRIFPHRMSGEGHFLALLERKGGELPADAAELRRGLGRQGNDRRANVPAGGARVRTAKENTPDRRADMSAGGARAGKGGSARGGGGQNGEREILLDFLKDVSMPMDENRLEIRKGQAYYVPEFSDEKAGLVFLRNGLYLGKVKKDRFEPSQSLALALKKEQYAQVLDLPAGDVRVQKYLKGETIDVEERDLHGAFSGAGDEDLHGAHVSAGEQKLRGAFSGAGKNRSGDAKGWHLVCVEGYPLGWGKLAGGVLKNKLHAGWRMQ